VSGQRQVEISQWFGELESTFYKHPESPHPDIFRVSNDAAKGCTGPPPPALPPAQLVDLSRLRFLHVRLQKANPTFKAPILLACNALHLGCHQATHEKSFSMKIFHYRSTLHAPLGRHLHMSCLPATLLLKIAGCSDASMAHWCATLHVGAAGVGRTGWHIDGSFQEAPFHYSTYHIVRHVHISIPCL